MLIRVVMDHARRPNSGSLVASRRRVIFCAGLAAILGTAFASVPDAAGAQDYPTRSVKIIVPFPAGGTADLMPRIIADFLSRKWKQAVVIENKPGAAGNIGAEAAFYAEPDGYTLLSAPAPPLVINQSLYPKLGFDPSALVVNPKKVSAKTVAELIAYARADPGRLTSATQGNGTTSHLPRKCSR